MSCIYWEEISYAEFLSCFSGYSRPTSLQDRGRDSDDEDFRDRDYDVAALASNLSQAFKYGIYSNEDIDEVSPLLPSAIFMYMRLIPLVKQHSFSYTDSWCYFWFGLLAYLRALFAGILIYIKRLNRCLYLVNNFLFI